MADSVTETPNNTCATIQPGPHPRIPIPVWNPITLERIWCRVFTKLHMRIFVRRCRYVLHHQGSGIANSTDAPAVIGTAIFTNSLPSAKPWEVDTTGMKSELKTEGIQTRSTLPPGKVPIFWNFFDFDNNGSDDWSFGRKGDRCDRPNQKDCEDDEGYNN